MANKTLATVGGFLFLLGALLLSAHPALTGAVTGYAEVDSFIRSSLGLVNILGGLFIVATSLRDH